MSQVERSKTPLRAIREKCIECSGDNRAEAANCQVSDCALFIYRMGTNPRRRRVGRVKNITPRSATIEEGSQHTTRAAIMNETPTQHATGTQGGALVGAS